MHMENSTGPELINLQKFLANRVAQQESQPRWRRICPRCIQPQFSCYCVHLHPFDPHIKFIILIHPIEHHRRIATGRMAYLMLENAELIMGHDFSNNEKLNACLSNPNYQSVLLYPGAGALNLSSGNCSVGAESSQSPKKLQILVVDGTWATAKKMVNLSKNLQNLPRICFTPPHPSRFWVRRQPKPHCFSTIEAVHHTIELLGEQVGYNNEMRAHDRLLSVFNILVEQQLRLQSYQPREHERPCHSRKTASTVLY